MRWFDDMPWLALIAIGILLAALWFVVRLTPKGLVAQLCHEVQASHA